MAIKLKSGVDPETLRKFGFKTGKEFAEQGETCFEGCEYQYNWYHKFAMDPDFPEKIYYVYDSDIPLVSLSFRIGNGDDLYIDCAPDCTYHVGGKELDIVIDTLYDLFNVGLIEKI